MAKLPDYPGVSSFVDRHGKTRWRYRGKDGSSKPLSGEPHTKPFDDAYRALIEGRPLIKAEIVKMPGAIAPQSFRAAYRLLHQTAKWQKLDEKSLYNYRLEIEGFLCSPVAQGEPEIWGDMSMVGLRPRHVDTILDRHAGQPFKARKLLTVLRKLIRVAIRQEWLDFDPSLSIEPLVATTDGHRAWPLEVRQQFEGYWVPGTQAHTAYALALWLGNRRSDVATLRWDQMVSRTVMLNEGERTIEGFEFTQQKGRNRASRTTLFLPMTPMLSDALRVISDRSGTILKTISGRPYAQHSLSEMMKLWTRKASIERGYTLHGLRKSLGGMLADNDASTRQLMDILGHKAIAHAELYSRSASQVRLATQGMDKVTKAMRR